MLKRIGLFSIPLVGLLSGCVVTPPLSEATGTEESPIFIKDVVQRVKCELSDAFDKKVEDPHYMWLASWTAKVDLTLTINDNAGLNANTSYTKTFRSVPNRDAGRGTSSATNPTFPSVSQFFAVSVGANLSGQANRTETVSFTVALDELKLWREHINKMESAPNYPADKKTCNFGFSTGVTGNLGLKEWVDSAFYPVQVYELQAGIHPSQSAQKSAKAGTTSGGGGGKAAAKTAITPEEIKRRALAWQTELTNLDTLLKLYTENIPKSNTKITAAKASLDVKLASLKSDASTYGKVLVGYLRQRIQLVDRELKVFVKNANTCYERMNGYTKNIAEAKRLADNILKASGDDQSLMFGELSDKMDEVGSKTASGQYVYQANLSSCDEALKLDASKVEKLGDVLPDQIDPPIDSVLHSLTFTISYGASISPNWSLIQWKGPSNSGNLAAASGVRTHNLQIALAPRTGKPAISPDALRLIQNQTIRSIGQ